MDDVITDTHALAVEGDHGRATNRWDAPAPGRHPCVTCRPAFGGDDALGHTHDDLIDR